VRIALVSLTTVAVGGAAIWWFASRPPSGPIVRLAIVPAAYYLPLMVAHDQKLFERHGFRSTIESFNSNTDMINSLIKGDTDVSALGSGGAFPLEAISPGKVRFVYGQNSSSYSLVVPKSSPIQNIEDLRGKRIGTWQSPTPRAFLHLILDSRIGPKAFEINPVDFKYLNQNLKSGAVDALLNTDVYTQAAIESGEARYLSRNPMEEFVLKPFFNGGGLVLRDIAQRKPDIARVVDAVMSEAVTYIQLHEADARKSMTRHIEKLSETVALAAPLDRFVQLPHVDLNGAQRVADLLSDLPPDEQTGKKLLPRRIDVVPMFR
jgi:ABC-type nitrate/sulfonate/bicarbonate transport system substrate-binding protein